MYFLFFNKNVPKSTEKIENLCMKFPAINSLPKKPELDPSKLFKPNIF